MASKVSTLTEKDAPALGDEVYLVDRDASPASKKAGVDRLLALMGALPGGRLTLTSGVPITTSNVSAASTLYYTFHTHDFITIFDGSRWVAYRFTERSLALSGLTSDKNYDVFIYDNAGTLTLELTVWTNDTTRATALTRLNGILVKTGATTRRFLGTLRTTATTTTEDSDTKRFLSNAYHRVPRSLKNSSGTSHTYATNTVRQWNNAAANKVEFIDALGDQQLFGSVGGNVENGVGAGCATLSFNLDSVTAETVHVIPGAASTGMYAGAATVFTTGVTAGYHYFAATERCAGGTCTFGSYHIEATVLG